MTRFPTHIARQPLGRIAGVELGGTKCVCVIADRDGAILDQRTVPTTMPEATLTSIGAVLDAWWSAGGFDAIGIASFGPIELDTGSPRYGYITATSKPNWRDTDVAARLSARFDVPMAFDTDVNGAAMAEGRWGAADGLDDFAYVTVGTGVGVGLVVHGRPTRGIGHCELGHIGVPRLAGDDWSGSCPFHGDCVEGLASGSAIKARLGSEHVGTVGPDHAVWDTVVDALAQMAQVMVLATGPRRIVMGGGVIDRQSHLIARIEARLRGNLAGYVELPVAPYILPPGLGDLAGPLGPIALALQAAEISARP